MHPDLTTCIIQSGIVPPKNVGEPMPTTTTVQGRIIAIQEMRFRILTGDGRGFLFTLSHNANADADDLRRWHRHDSLVQITYSGEPGLTSGVARTVESM